MNKDLSFTEKWLVEKVEEFDEFAEEQCDLNDVLVGVIQEQRRDIDSLAVVCQGLIGLIKSRDAADGWWFYNRDKITMLEERLKDVILPIKRVN